MASNQYPKIWNWAHEAHARPLVNWTQAPDETGFYELGYMNNGFKPMYCGRAAGVTLRARLRTHYLGSHNDNVRKHRAKLWFRCKTFKTFELACYVEAVHIIALDYPWNNRNEWAKHWALEH